ncbi:MAG: metallophosphoesterase [Planctomycetota bacterium]|nr:metallophosphoesterase [Planctomycetota bacterium]
MPCVLQLTDLHLMTDPSAVLQDICTRVEVERVFAYVRAGIASGRWSFDQIVITGDLAHDEQRATYDILREMLGDWLPTCKLLLGNHDSRPFIREVFPELAPREPDFLTFSCRVGDWQLIGLESHISGEVEGELGERQLEWLAAELRLHAQQPTVLFVHHPPFDVGSAWVDALGLRDAESLLQVATSAPQVKAICTGHVHQEREKRVGDLQLLTTPSAAVQFGVDSPEFSLDSIPPGFRVLYLEDEAFRSEVIRLPR